MPSETLFAIFKTTVSKKEKLKVGVLKNSLKSLVVSAFLVEK